MLLTPHVLVGTAIAVTLQNPVLAVPLSFVMHFMGDLVPHWDFYSNTTDEQRTHGWRPIAVMADLGLAVAIGVTFTLYALWILQMPNLALNIFLCGIASVLPDAISSVAIFNGQPWPVKIIFKLQAILQFQAPLPWGIISQLIVIAVSLLTIGHSLTL